jgi:hypothetical protein
MTTCTSKKGASGTNYQSTHMLFAIAYKGLALVASIPIDILLVCLIVGDIWLYINKITQADPI